MDNIKPIKPVQQVTQTKPTVEVSTKAKINNNKKFAIVAAVIVLLGVGTGFALAKSSSTNSTASPLDKSANAIKTDKEVGLKDEATFKDTAEGVLQDGGIAGEGTHHLVRPGGDSQKAYLTSTVVDLGSFVGKKVQVWGQTISARKAGWLMDVGKIKILE